jgi:hypothetical protein
VEFVRRLPVSAVSPIEALDIVILDGLPSPNEILFHTCPDQHNNPWSDRPLRTVLRVEIGLFLRTPRLLQNVKQWLNTPMK